MTDKQLKLLIEEAAGVEELAEAYKEASARALVVERERTVAVTTLKTTQDRHAALMGELVILNADMDIFEGTRKDKAKVELAKIKPLQDAIDMNQGRITAFDEPTLIANQTRLEASLAAHDAEKAALKVLVDAETIASMSVVAARSAASTLKGIYDKRVTALADIDSQVGKPCGECGKAYCEHDLEGAKVARQTQIDAAKTDLMKAATDLKAKIPLHEDATKTAATYRASMTDVSVAVAEMGTIRGWLREVTSLRSGIASLTSDIERLKAAAKRHLTDPNPWTKAVEGKQAEIDKIEIEIATLTFECLALEDKAEVYANAVKVFGPAGVRAHILDTVTPFLNEKTSEYLGALSDGNIHATWSTLTKTAKGELKEKFNIEVTNDKGGKTFKAISGGEKRKVRLAAALALQDMVATRASKPINLFLADEIDDALDEPGMERLMGVLEKKAKERGTVLVISHRSLTDWIDVVINVTKSGGVSTVTGATVRGF
jgi:chromosome segregation ATPase